MRRIATVGFLLAVSAGCASGTGDLRLVSYVDPYFPDTYNQHLPYCSYWKDAGGDLHVAALSHPPDAPPTRDVAQALELHMFWKPTPGTTVDNPTALNTEIHYVIHTPGGVACYSGVGFAFVKKARLGDGLEIDIEDAELALDARSGELPEVLGRSRVTGRLSARADANQTVDICRRIEMLASRARGKVASTAGAGTAE